MRGSGVLDKNMNKEERESAVRCAVRRNRDEDETRRNRQTGEYVRVFRN